VNGKLHALGHEKAGVPIAKRFLRRLTSETRLTEYVLNMTELHMQPNMRAAAGAGDKSFMRLFDASVAPDDLLLLAKADWLGRIGPESDRAQMERDYEEIEKKLRDELALYRERMAAPCVMGRDLVEAGIQPGPRMGEGLAYAHKLRLAGLSKDEQLRQTLGFLRRNRTEDAR
jgi:tRNA nucleotidyltransferase (CCA-adding enzyme)